MVHERIEEIELKARDILRTVFGDLTELSAPVNLGRILQQFHLKLSIAKFGDSAIAGVYDKADKEIFVSTDDAPPRQAFTVAHEIGHFFLHTRKEDVFYRNDITSFNGNLPQEEQEANWFAANLLMPKELVIKFWERSKDVELLALYFGVSRSAAYWRLKNLGLRQ